MTTTNENKKTADEALAAFPVRMLIAVQWGEMDAFQHVNNVVYFRWFESARMRLFEAIGFTGSDVVGPILHSTSCRYRAPVYYPDALVAGARVVEIGSDRFTMEMAVFSANAGTIAATGEATIVAYDYGTKAKTALPAEVVARIRGLSSPSSS